MLIFMFLASGVVNAEYCTYIMVRGHVKNEDIIIV